MNGICFCNEAPIATNDEECPNFILVHSGGYEFIYAGDGNPMKLPNQQEPLKWVRNFRKLAELEMCGRNLSSGTLA